MELKSQEFLHHDLIPSHHFRKRPRPVYLCFSPSGCMTNPAGNTSITERGIYLNLAC